MRITLDFEREICFRDPIAFTQRRLELQQRNEGLKWHNQEPHEEYIRLQIEYGNTFKICTKF